MQIIQTKLHICSLVLLILIFGILDFYPYYGPPFFRYTGADPNHHVWNFGWPISWTIYDDDTPPFWIKSPPLVCYLVLITQGGLLLGLLLLPRMLRKK